MEPGVAFRWMAARIRCVMGEGREGVGRRGRRDMGSEVVGLWWVWW